MTQALQVAPNSIEPGTVVVTIPCSAEYVSVARLAILGVAGRLGFSYDETEDIRLAVGEACTHAVERATPSKVSGATITITSTVSADGLRIVIVDNVPVAAAHSAPLTDPEFPDLDIDRHDLGALLMEILVDEVDVRAEPAGTTVRLYKRAPAHHSAAPQS